VVQFDFNKRVNVGATPCGRPNTGRHGGLPLQISKTEPLSIFRSGYDTGADGSRLLFEKLLGHPFELLKFGIFVDERRLVEDGGGSDPAISDRQSTF
jgi:hypothetical protein